MDKAGKKEAFTLSETTTVDEAMTELSRIMTSTINQTVPILCACLGGTIIEGASTPEEAKQRLIEAVSAICEKLKGEMTKTASALFEEMMPSVLSAKKQQEG